MLSWDYLEFTLTQWGFGSDFLAWIKTLYSSPTASVKYAGFLSSPFWFFWGMRQGHPLSPALFSLVLEPLAMALQDNPDISGVPYAGNHYKANFYADHALLVLTNLITTLLNLQAILDNFSAISGLHINLSKTTTLPAHLVTHLQTQFPYCWAPHSIDYLGIKLTSSYSTLFSANYYPSLRSLTSFLRSWQFSSLSWIGRIHAVKMTILPKVLYFFGTLPTHVPSFYLYLLQNRVLLFIWAHKRPQST